ncbi:long-chain-fatty-acid--CoA ligase 4 [Trichonephila clavipes]|uniref:long-chain-fatty-acid--CoA ligase n=1 Tax=Trichonephila clavipes TaxID=2585209 RepID=A0A8X6SIB2_TRICX|nr:long-chain-fatty-acid--CoA ligase 4 [Trichonephila clavipes]
MDHEILNHGQVMWTVPELAPTPLLTITPHQREDSKLEDDRDPYSCYVRQVHHKKPEENGVKTMDELFRSAVEKFGERECYGVREVLGEEVEEASSGKVFKKMNLGEYKWSRFNEINQRVDDVSKGLLSLGVRSKKPVILLAETRLEWIITAQACFRINVPDLDSECLIEISKQSENSLIQNMRREIILRRIDGEEKSFLE